MRIRVTSTGKSAALVVPAGLLRELGWSVGDEVEVHPMLTGVSYVTPGKGRSMRDIGRKILRKYPEVFAELAKR